MGEHDFPEQEPIITLPEGRRELFAAKRDQYLKRLEDRHPDFAMTMGDLEGYKYITMHQLVSEGRISTWSFTRDLEAKLGEAFNPELARIALAVVDDYCKTGGENVSGGTGLYS